MKDNRNIKICEDLKTKEKIYIKHSDRYLNTMALGKDRKNKISKVLLPMLSQDLRNSQYGATIFTNDSLFLDDVTKLAKNNNRNLIIFNPLDEKCPTINPLYGKEEFVIENLVAAFSMQDPDGHPYFKDMNEQLLRNAIKVLKRVKGNSATLLSLNGFIRNICDEGKLLVDELLKIPVENDDELKENTYIAEYFINNYFVQNSKTYEDCSKLRSAISKIILNKYLNVILNPKDGIPDIILENHLKTNDILYINTNIEIFKDISEFLGRMLLFSFQAAVFSREGNHETRTPHFLYIDEFQEFVNFDFINLLTQGRSYRIFVNILFEDRNKLLENNCIKINHLFIESLYIYCKNRIILSGVSEDDAHFISDEINQSYEKLRPDKILKCKKNNFVCTKENLMNQPENQITYSLYNNLSNITGQGKI